MRLVLRKPFNAIKTVINIASKTHGEVFLAMRQDIGRQIALLLRGLGKRAPFLTQKETNGGSNDTDVNELAVSPKVCGSHQNT